MKRGVPGPEGSLPKWQWGEINQALTELAVDIIGEEGTYWDSPWTYRLLRSRANSIEGGTTEILKNIIAERVLGLPKLVEARRAAGRLRREESMNFDFSDDQQAIKRTAKDLLADRFKLERVRELADAGELRRRRSGRSSASWAGRASSSRSSTAARASASSSW